MQKQLITPDEVIEIAFSPQDQIDPAIITDSRIEAAQLKFLAPALKKWYYSLTGGFHENFCREYIKPALAYFVKYHLFLHLSVRIGNDGIIRIRPADSTTADASEIGRLRRESRETAYLLLKKATDQMKKKNKEFPGIDAEDNSCKRPRVNGGIII